MILFPELDSLLINDSPSPERLGHLLRSRPKKPKTRAPSRSAQKSLNKLDDKSEENDAKEKIDYGVDNFFKTGLASKLQMQSRYKNSQSPDKSCSKNAQETGVERVMSQNTFTFPRLKK